MSANRSRPVQTGNDDEEKSIDNPHGCEGPGVLIGRVVRLAPTDDPDPDDVQAVAVRHCQEDVSIEDAWREHANSTFEQWGDGE